MGSVNILKNQAGNIPNFEGKVHLTSQEIQAASHSALNKNYNIGLIVHLESGYMGTSLTQPAVKNEHIPQIMEVIEQIIGSSSIDDIHGFLDNTTRESAQSRIDLQKCGKVLSKIAGIQEETINWNTIFSRLNLDKKEAA